MNNGMEYDDKDADDITDWIADIQERGRNLSKWEEVFVDGMAKIHEEGKHLTEAQYIKLQQIWYERVSR